MVDGKREVKYVEYLGRAGAKPSTNTSTSSTLVESESKIREYNIELEKLGADASQELKKLASDEYAQRDKLLIQAVADEKGKPLNKIEAGLYAHLKPSNFAELENYVQLYVDRQYKAGDGLLAIRTGLSAAGVDVSTTTIKKHLVDAGIYESRPFGHERKERPRETALEDEVRETKQALEDAINTRERHIEKVTDENDKLKKELARAQEIAKMWEDSAKSK